MHGRPQSRSCPRSLWDAQKSPPEPHYTPARAASSVVWSNRSLRPLTAMTLWPSLSMVSPPRSWGKRLQAPPPELFPLLPATPTKRARPLCSTTLDGTPGASRPSGGELKGGRIERIIEYSASRTEEERAASRAPGPRGGWAGGGRTKGVPGGQLPVNHRDAAPARPGPGGKRARAGRELIGRAGGAGRRQKFLEPQDEGGPGQWERSGEVLKGARRRAGPRGIPSAAPVPPSRHCCGPRLVTRCLSSGP